MSNVERGVDVGLSGMGVKRAGTVLGAIFVVTLAVVVAKQMSAEAIAVVVGVACGVAAGIPASLLVLVALRTDRRKPGLARDPEHQGYPPVVVIQGGTPQGLPSGSPTGYWPGMEAGPPARREFHVVGGDDLLLEGQERSRSLWP